MCSQLITIFLMIPFDSGFLDRSVPLSDEHFLANAEKHLFDLAVGQRMAVLD
ncbi:MAG: hypothetical protein ACJAVR_000893 [Paracoccaceae bacterium]|jgi:hypothetical protein